MSCEGRMRIGTRQSNCARPRAARLREESLTCTSRAGSTSRDREDLADAQNVGAQAVGAADARRAHAITLGYLRERFAASDDVPHELGRFDDGVLREVAALGRIRREIVDYPQADRERKRGLILGA